MIKRVVDNYSTGEYSFYNSIVFLDEVQFHEFYPMPFLYYAFTKKENFMFYGALNTYEYVKRNLKAHNHVYEVLEIGCHNEINKLKRFHTYW